MQLARSLGMKIFLSHWWRGLSHCLGLPEGELEALSWLREMWGQKVKRGALVTSVFGPGWEDRAQKFDQGL